MGRTASYSTLLFDAEERRSGQIVAEKVESVDLHRDDDVSNELHRVYEAAPVYKFRRLSSSTIYSVSLLLIVTVFAWAILDCRARVCKLEHALRYMYYKQRQML